MGSWPKIADPELRRRLALTDDEFLAMVREFAGSVGARETSDAIVERALGYPWARPASSFLLRGEEAVDLETLEPAERERRVGGALAAGHALLAFGSNGSPDALALKFGDLPDAERELVVLAGDLHDFDVGAAPLPTFYGSLPATLFPSPGASVRASLLLVSDAQLARLAWSEISYFLGRLDGVRFVPDTPGLADVGSLLGFVSRWGALCVDGEPVAMAAVPAAQRAAPALTQEQLLDHVAARILDPASRARDLIGAVMADFGGTALRVVEELGDAVRHFSSERWTRYEEPV